MDISTRHPESAPGRLTLGQVVVADTLRLSAQSALQCPAAPLLAGELRRSGSVVRRGALHIGEPLPADGAVRRLDHGTPPTVTIAAALDTGGRAAGLGVALAADDRHAESAARGAMAKLTALVNPRTVLLASPRSFCAGVERAIEAVKQALSQYSEPVYVRKQIVHNAHVVDDLREGGAIFVSELDDVPDGATVVFSAHGVSPRSARTRTGGG